MTNVTDSGLTYEVLTPCTTTIRLYPQDEFEHAWDQLDWLNSSPAGCERVAHTLAIAPGTTRTFTGSAAIEDILGDSLPPTTYIASLFVWAGTGPNRFIEIRDGPVDLSH